MRLLHFTPLLFGINLVFSYDDYTCVIPNGGNVFIEGQKVRALGHASILGPIVSISRANPFGKDYELAVREEGDFAAAWYAVCDKDSDGDGFTNGEELCDPQCNSANTVPKCPNGTFPTHPGGIVPLEDDIYALKLHAWFMVAAWCICAPYGILRAAFFKTGVKKTWYKDHVYALNLCVLLNVAAMLVVLIEYGFDPLVDAFSYSSEFTWHCIIGFFAFLLTIMQPISGYFRPDMPKEGEEKSKNRIWWEYQHRYTGRLALILALVSIYLGIPLLYYIGGKALSFTLLPLMIITGIGSVVFVLFFRKKTIYVPPNFNEGRKLEKVVPLEEPLEPVEGENKVEQLSNEKTKRPSKASQRNMV